MTRYEISDRESGVAIELTGVAGAQQELLQAFGECQAGRCSCPTDEYEKVAAMEVVPSQDAISIRLEARPGTRLDPREIAACLDHTIDAAGT